MCRGDRIWAITDRKNQDACFPNAIALNVRGLYDRLWLRDRTEWLRYAIAWKGEAFGYRNFGQAAKSIARMLTLVPTLVPR
ncbi:MAG TPA: hypothetical protein V6D48_08215 [Oculatellaceae cyanobacterium]